jgi:hypothetical protein
MCMSFNGVLFADMSESERPDGERGRFEPFAMEVEDILCDKGW